jgi:hypothetical protein
MAVLVMSEVPLTAEAYDGMTNALEETIKGWPGFVAHVGGPTQTGWRVVEIWESAEQANQFFAKAVHPLIPPGVRPKRSVAPLHRLIRPG